MRKPRNVPAGRLSRLFQVGSLATRIAGSVVANSSTQLLRGNRPSLKHLLLTPANIQRIADQLGKMRGAAMKLGQLISMDSGDLIAPELAEILARLRDDADPMPKQQVIEVLNAAWGEQWQDDLLYFSFAPSAAASIGQVHKAITRDGETLAVKIQYPGIKESIDSDIDNLASLLKLVGLLPDNVDVSPLLDAAKAQLHQEADYLQEADNLTTYRNLVGDTDEFELPELFPPLNAPSVLAMTFVKGGSLEVVETLPQAQRNELMGSLFRLFFRELFEFGVMQTDPNMANYAFNPETQRIVLLDFGAVRHIPKDLAEQYRALLNAAANSDATAMAKAALSIGLIDENHSDEIIAQVVAMGMLACESIHHAEYDFGSSDVLARIQQLAMALSFEHDFWQIPPIDAVFIHRKLGGLYLLAKRLKVTLDMRALASEWLD